MSIKEDEKLHWYNFSYMSTNQTIGSSQTGYPLKFVNLKMINKNKEYAGMEYGSVLLSVSYLGYGTHSMMKGED